MKTNLSLLLALVSVTLATATVHAAPQSLSPNVVELPAYQVTADRYTEAELSVEQSLAELRASATASHYRQISTELPSLGITVDQAHHDVARSVAGKVSANAKSRS
ncbi:MAG: hypothetical protein Q8M02_00385 [Candidatus Didemnitutus sp.]|nr:hypothetical protein [Candidatus Didemnitutus sp.]